MLAGPLHRTVDALAAYIWLSSCRHHGHGGQSNLRVCVGSPGMSTPETKTSSIPSEAAAKISDLQISGSEPSPIALVRIGSPLQVLHTEASNILMMSLTNGSAKTARAGALYNEASFTVPAKSARLLIDGQPLDW